MIFVSKFIWLYHFQKLCAEALAENDGSVPAKDTQPANVGEEMEKFAKTRFRTPLLSKLFSALGLLLAHPIPSPLFWTNFVFEVFEVS